MNPREFITKALSDAKTTFDFFDALVARMESDAAKIAELEKQRDDCRAAVHGMFGVDYPLEPSE